MFVKQLPLSLSLSLSCVEFGSLSIFFRDSLALPLALPLSLALSIAIGIKSQESTVQQVQLQTLIANSGFYHSLSLTHFSEILTVTLSERVTRTLSTFLSLPLSLSSASVNIFLLLCKQEFFDKHSLQRVSQLPFTKRNNCN